MPFVSMTEPTSALLDLHYALPNEVDLRFVAERLARPPHPNQSIPDLSTRSCAATTERALSANTRRLHARIVGRGPPNHPFAARRPAQGWF